MTHLPSGWAGRSSPPGECSTPLRRRHRLAGCERARLACLRTSTGVTLSSRWSQGRCRRCDTFITVVTAMVPQ
eukprot:159176-Prorocentrum_minimum.AAC.1